MQNQEFKGQFDDEEVMMSFRRHPVVMRKGLVLLMVAVLIGAVGGMIRSGSAASTGEFFVLFFTPVLISIAVGLIPLSYFWIGWYYSVCIVTDQRFIQFKQKGIFKSRSVNDIALNRILSVNYEVSGMMETLLGFGTIIVQTFAGDFILKNVPHPAENHQKIATIVKESGVDLNEDPQEALAA
jgi:hypothetical protein